jgi:hypothetical protein
MTVQDETLRTAILTIDDDPGVSRAVARDLRRRWSTRRARRRQWLTLGVTIIVVALASLSTMGLRHLLKSSPDA